MAISDRAFKTYHDVGNDELYDRARRGGMKAFTTLTFPEYEWNWHHVITCNWLNKFVRREPGWRRLMIFEPPRHGKTELTSRRLPALIHGMYPNDEILAATYNGDLATDMTMDVQRIMDTPVYQKIFPETRIPKEGTSGKYARNKQEHELIPVQNPVDRLWTIPRGSYRSAGVGGSFTGRGANWALIDDPIKGREDADSKAFRDSLWKWYTSTLRTRLEGEGSILITLTRWHNDDLVGRLLELAKSDPNADQWKILMLPALKENDKNEEDPRQIGEGLWLNKFTMKNYMALKAGGERDWSALYQQRPSIEGGNIIKRAHFRYYSVLPARFDQVIQSWDFAVKDKQTSDYTVGGVWGRIGQDKYLIDLVRGRWSFPVALQELVKLSRKHPSAYKKLIEAKANGPAVIQSLKQTVGGLVEVEPMGDKVSRLNAAAPDFEAGNVYLPEKAPWLDEYETEMINFPNWAKDDQVDMTSQAVNELRKAVTITMPIVGHGSGIVY